MITRETEGERERNKMVSRRNKDISHLEMLFW